MRYYLNTSTQSAKEGGGYNEFGKKETKGVDEAGKIAAIAELHETYATMIKSSNLVYWMGKVEDTKGNVLDKLEAGKYIDAEA